MKRNIFAVVVAYNPERENFISNLQMLSLQVEKIVICNNSKESLVGYSDEYHIIELHENLGIAKAQSISMKWAFENGAEFVLQMDQDSIPNEDMVDNLIRCYDDLTNSGYSVGLVGPQDFDRDSKELNKARLNKGKIIKESDYVSLENTLSSGSLIPKSIYDIVGGMDDDLFIDAVDSEYCWRIRRFGYLVIKNNKALLGHKLGDGKKQVFGTIKVGVSSPIRNYYQIRNVFLLVFRSYVPIYWKLSQLFKVSLKLFFYPFILEKGFTRFKYMLWGLRDGLLRKKGRFSYD